MPNLQYGMIVWYNEEKKFGFIKVPEGGQVFFHANDWRSILANYEAPPEFVLQPKTRLIDVPRIGQNVVFGIAAGKYGKPKAAPWNFVSELQFSMGVLADYAGGQNEYGSYSFLADLRVVMGDFCRFEICEGKFTDDILKAVGYHELPWPGPREDYFFIAGYRDEYSVYPLRPRVDALLSGKHQNPPNNGNQIAEIRNLGNPTEAWMLFVDRSEIGHNRHRKIIIYPVPVSAIPRRRL